MTSTGLSRAVEPVDRREFTECLARWPSGVAVVTTAGGDGVDRGFTATAFSSLSVAPPTVLVCLDRGSQCLPAFRTAPAMAVHLLRRDQEEIALRFATKGADKFAGVPVERGLHGVPLLPDTVGRLECRLIRRVDAGDHVILIGLVCAAATGEGEPLVYFARGFHGL